MAARWIAACALFVAALGAAAWYGAQAGTAPEIAIRAADGRFYAVDFSRGPRPIDLDFAGDSRYELIVASLASGVQTCQVRLVAQPVPRVQAFPAAAISRPSGRRMPVQREGQAPPPAKAAASTALSERRFFMHVTAGALDDERSYVPVTGVLAGEGQEVRVYADSQTPSVGLQPGLVGEIIRVLDDEIIPRSRALLGEHQDVDGDGKLAVLVTGWLGRLCGGKTSLNGFVRSNDFQEEVAAPFGNHADVIYLNSALPPGPALKALLAHEYTHTVCFSRRLAAGVHPVPLPVEEDWLNEAIAHVAENCHADDWSNLDQRVAAFLAKPQDAPLVVRDYYRAGLWRDPGSRGAAYLFLRFCTDRFGERLLRDLVDAPAAGRRNLEWATGIGFPELFRQWTVALAREEIPSVPLRGNLGGCTLGGVARIPWRVDQGPCVVELRGTAMALVSADGNGRPGTWRVTVEAPPQVDLQVTLRKLNRAAAQ